MPTEQISDARALQDSIIAQAQRELRALLALPSDPELANEFPFGASEQDPVLSKTRTEQERGYQARYALKVPSIEDAPERYLKFRLVRDMPKGNSAPPIPDELFLRAYGENLQEFVKVLTAAGPDARGLLRPVRETLVERAIARQLAQECEGSVASPALETPISEAIGYLKQLALSTYEGGQITMNVVVDPRLCGEWGIALSEYGDRNRHAWGPTLGTSSETALVVGSRGLVHKVVNTSGRPDDLELESERYPYFLENLVAYSKTVSGIGLASTVQGDVVVIAQGHVRYAFRRGQWRSFPETFGKAGWIRGGKVLSGVKKAVRETLLDASFAGHGGSIAIVGYKKLDELADDASEHAALPAARQWSRAAPAETSDEKRARLVLEGMDTLSYLDLGRAQRLELLSMDGITVIDFRGKLLASGQIVTVKDANSGGRTSAVKRLAEYGAAFKVSQDGQVDLWGSEEQGLPVVRRVSFG